MKTKSITIQPHGNGLGAMPYPYHIGEQGMVGRQEFWKGEPHKLLGFSATPKAGKMELSFEDFWKSPKKAVRMFPVFTDDKGNWSTLLTHIESIHEYEKEKED